MIDEEALFLVWGPPSHGPRSRVLARELGIAVEFVEATKRRGLLVAPYKYALQFSKTLRLLRRRRPRLVFVQSPPHLAVATVAAYCALAGGRYVIDAHSAALLSPIWTRPHWLNRILFRKAVVTIVTNEHFSRSLERKGARALVLRDVPTEFALGAAPELAEGFHVLVVNTFSSDEPLGEVIEAARAFPDTTFHVTGRIRGHGFVRPKPPPNVSFTGFLPDEDYYALMREADVVMCLTTRDHTMQRGACEALSLGRPIITSDFELLRAYFDRGTIHVDNTAASIRSAVSRMRRHHSNYVREIEELRSSQWTEWCEVRDRLEKAVGVIAVGRRNDGV